MKYTMTSPCDQCPFLNKMKRGFTISRLRKFASGEFPCHQTADNDEETGDYVANDKSVQCAGALVFNEKRNTPNQMMRICERLGLYDARKLNMDAPVR